MFFELMICVLIGVCFGIVTGITPGVHVNLVSVVLLSISPMLLKIISPLALSVTIISMAITHTFLDIIPSIFLGAPDSDEAASVLPGHRLLLEGKGYEAVMLTIIGALGGLVISMVMLPLFVPLAKYLYPVMKGYIGYILLAVIIFLILREKEKLAVTCIFLFSGALGIGVFSLVELKDPLFPLLSGLFGTSMLLLSIKDNTKIPEQKTAGIEFEKEKGIKATLCSVVAGWFCSFMPGLGPSEAAILGSTFFKDLGNKGFLILTGGLGTVNMALSLVTFYTLDKARNGAIVTVSGIISKIDYNTFLVFWGVSLAAGGIATVLASKLSKVFAKLMCRINYKILCISIICLVTFLVIIISGWLGLLVLTVSTFFGMIPALKNVGRNHMMGCLLVPVMIYFLL